MKSTATITVRVELPPRLAPRLAAAAWRTDLADSLRDEIGCLTAGLGVPSEVAVEVAANARPRPSVVHSVRVYVGPTLCRIGQEQALRVYALVRGDVLVKADSAEIAHWLDTADSAAARFVTLLAREAIARDPSVLLSPAHLESIAAELDLAPAQRERLGIVARKLLALGIAINKLSGDGIAVLKDDTLSPADAAEGLVAVLKPTTVDIHVAPAALRQLTLAAGDDDRGKFGLLRDGLFHEYGLRFPDFRFVEDPALEAGCFAFKMNDLVGLPWIGLAAGEQLVNDSADRVAELFGVRARPAANPWDGSACAVVAPPIVAERARVRGISAHSPFEYLVMCLSFELRRLSWRLLDCKGVAHELQRLSDAFPALVRCTRERYTDTHLAQVMRALVAEGMPLRDLRLLLTALVDFDTIVTDPSAYIVIDDRVTVNEAPAGPPPPALLVTAIRNAQRRYLTHKHSSGNWRLSVLLLDPHLEREVRDRNEQGALLEDASWCDRLLDAIAAEAPAWGETDRPPCLLTTMGLRDALRRLVALELPHLPVLEYQDLAPGSSISVRTRISLSSALASAGKSGGE
jgi:hypothetical protein